MNYWDREEVIAQIKYRHRLSRNISYVGVLEEFPHLLFAAVYYFKNWRVAVTSAGMDYSKVKKLKSWNREKIKRKIVSLSRKGNDLSYQGMRESGYINLISAASFCFGNWGKAVLASDLPYADIRRKRVGCFLKF